jgi:hypothetical protein
MLPPPSPAGEPPAPNKQRAGLPVLFVALAVLLGLIALVWWLNEQDSDDEPWRSRARAAAVVGSPT